MGHGDVFEALKARYCIAAIIVAWYWQPGSQLLLGAVRSSEWYWPGLVFQYYAHATMALFLIVAALVAGLKAGHLLGRPLVRQDLSLVLFVVVLTFCASTAILTALSVPVSYLLPEFATWWLLWVFQPVVYLTADGTLPIGANILGFVSLVLLAPILEEFLFRGYLLHRWSKKWGLWIGVLLSSAVFGVIHPDTLAAAVTGFGFAVLYLKTQTLWAPIVAHSIYNLVVWIWSCYGVLSAGFDYYMYTIDQLREDWWFGAVALIIVVLLINKILRRSEPLGPFALPKSDGSDAKQSA